MTPVILTNDSELDARSVTAVLGGDVERYRDLVERHERRVFAVAWSRLGDATLAEEATQETFIRGYGRLWLLRDGAKFSGWIASIGRRVAINLGLRHRRELKKRERWALEEVSTPETPAEESTEPPTPETLRRALAELPDAHRECLVLFYLEGKSGAEAAAALGISESALRVRLHRARTAMREHLEKKLEGSLEKLKPAKTIVPAVMGVVLLSSPAKAATAGGTAVAGLGAKILPMLGKTLLLSWFVPLASLIGSLPGMALAWWVTRIERRNYRERDGFRARLHRGFSRSFAWGYPLAWALILMINYWALRLGGMRAVLIFAISLILAMNLITARVLTIGRNPFQIATFAYGIIILIGVLALALGWIPPLLAQLPVVMASVVFLFVMKHRPLRMDYNLFLRAAQGLMKPPEQANETPKVEHLDRGALLAFARFLGSHWLASNFRWEAGGLALRLPPVKSSFIVNMTVVFMPPISRGCSYILLEWDGNIIAHCGNADATALAQLNSGEPVDARERERQVAEVTSCAWQEFRNGNIVLAERMLGETPESDVFIVPPGRARSTRWWRILIVVPILLIALMAVINWKHDQMRMVNGRMYEPVSLSDAEIRASLERIGNPSDKNLLIVSDLAFAEQTREVLPPTNMFTPAAWQSVREQLKSLFPSSNPATPSDQLDRLLGASALQGAFINGWLTMDDFGLDRQNARRAIADVDAAPYERKVWFELHESAIMDYKGNKLNYSVLDTRNLVRTARTLQKLGCMDLVDFTTNVETILRHQVLSASLPAEQRHDVDPKLLHGLFLTFGSDPIEDTYESLAILEACGALKRVDREACIEGILRFHHGKGLFGSVREHDGFVIFGDTRDTLFAFESLRMLNALDRVKDLEKWKFRPMSASEPATPAKPRVAIWEEVEAWVCQQRLEGILRERKENPLAPVRSLLLP